MAGWTPSDFDLYLFREGTLYESYRTFGAHLCEHEGARGVRFAVWAPRAVQVSVVGEWNGWKPESDPLECAPGGVWCGFLPGIGEGAIYKYAIRTSTGEWKLKADPYAFRSEVRPSTASIVYDLSGYRWKDMNYRKRLHESYERPLSVYEVHLGTWRRRDDGSMLSYEELADELVNYAADMGFTHIELLPLAEHPYDRSWGYQATGLYSVTSRFGSPKQFMAFVDRCHQRGIGVIMDWVPGHFCKDDHGLRRFDGTPLYEPEDDRLAEKIEWGTLGFDFGKPEVRSFLISNALYWMDMFHIDGLRVDAVASMLYLNFGKPADRHVYNRYGGEENLEAIEFLRTLNQAVFERFPGALMMAEDSTAWPLVTAPVHKGGLGFNYKWNMGWMNDMLEYMEKDPIHRKNHHKNITFSFLYAFSENFVLPLSHDEVVHGKKSLLNKMPGDYRQKFAGLRVLLGYMTAHPGKKLLFMGGEFGQFSEWNDSAQLDWQLLEYPMHASMRLYVRELNRFYAKQPALWQNDCRAEGFEWISPHDSEQSVIAFIRHAKQAKHMLIIVCNFTPASYPNYRIGVPLPGAYREVFNSDRIEYGGSGQKNARRVEADNIPWHDRAYSISISVPPLGIVALKRILPRKGQPYEA
ncbi:1,4-alpha-glucan branching protein GlgB [Paenibacillus thermotolerans]|uniref:1,4-alpha-glucan branching protein GlgB n=1 Tax=Paenibacillus thermotolerans TaxID=3027807 RepID=UPI00236828D7|nr:MULTISPECIES: 1,4-alpha-glucan branching protein GlgB [unclassified Paenibacillus]